MKLRYFSLSILLILFTTLYGCSGAGKGGDGLDAVSDDKNDFDKDEGGAFDPDPEPEPTATSASSHVKVRVEATAAMIADWKDHVFDFLTPAKAYAFRGLSTVEASSVEVIQVTSSLTARGTPTVDIEHTTVRNDDGTYGITFTSGSTPTQRLDLMVRARLSNGQLLFAPLVVDGSTIKVNVISTYVVQNFFSAIPDYDQSLTALLPCGQDLGCSNQPEARLMLWQGLTSAVHSFDTTIPANNDIDAATKFLDRQADFTNFVEKGFSLILGNGFVDAITAELNFEDYLNSASYQFNSLIFSLGIGDDTPDDGSPGAVLFNNATTITSQTLDNGTAAYTYPGLTETEFPTTLTIRSIFGDIPFSRRSVTLQSGGANTINQTLGNNTNSFASDPSSAFTGRNGVTSYGRQPYQNITGRNTDNVVGWLTNPLFSDFFGDTDRNYLVAAPASTGRAYRLNQLDVDEFSRDIVLEDTTEFNYMIHLQATPDGDFSAAAATDQRTYGVVSFSQNLTGSSDQLHSTSVSTKHWTSSGGSIIETQSTSGLPNHYFTQTISRSNDLVASDIVNTTNNSKTYGLQDASVGVWDSAQQTLVDKFIGRITLNLNGQQDQEGAVSALGDQIATYLAGDSSNEGFSHAIELTGSSPEVLNSKFMLQGHLFAVNSDNDEGLSFSGSSITIGDTLDATLSLKQQYSRINTENLSVTMLANRQELETQPQSVVVQDQQKIQFVFNDIFGDNLELQGFISSDGNFLIMMARLGNAIGVIYGYRDQELPLS